MAPLSSLPAALAVAACGLLGCRSIDATPAPPGETAAATAVAATVSATASAAGPSAASAPAPPPEGMVTVPEGVFLMGGESPENTPVREAVVARFYLDEKEVTMRAYAGCVEAGACKAPRVDNPFCNALLAGRDDHPVNCIDFHDAEAFCARAEKRLPTEPEWEYAARGGSEQRLYSWGNEEPDRARACYMHEGGSCVVGTHPAGAFGLFDMTGNVWEWTSSWYASYAAPTDTGFYKVYRGGSWSRRFAKWMRNDLRNRYRPEEQSASLGFRCAKDTPARVCPPDTVERGGTCVRVAGTPLCPKGELFAAGACRPGGIIPAHVAAGGGPLPAPAPGGSSPAASSAALAAPSASAAPVLSRARAPGFDADCARISPASPVAYSFTGGSFHDREPLVRAAGCKKRDVGVGWTSACCTN